MKYVWAILLSVFSVFSSHAQGGRSVVDADLRPFYHGVASGDPTDSSVMIWTRVTPDTGNTGSIKVYWQIARDSAFQQLINYGSANALSQNDYCVKVDVCGLQPGTFYYYMFHAMGQNSITGRTKTAPSKIADNDSVRFAVVSCADYENGYFNAYESISNKNNVDAVVHLGDYIYEYETGGISINNPGRSYEPLTEVISLADYRIRHSHYKLDPQLRRIHQLFPFITVWDDHETCNDAYRDGGDNHQANEGPYSVRKSNSTSSYFTWMPLRKPDPLDTIRIFRKLRYGKLLDLIMLDTRLYDRDLQNLGGANDPTRKLMGPIEMNWFLQQLSDTSTRWKIIGNQVMFAPLRVFGQPINADQWDGYNFERTQIQNHILNNNVKDVVVLTGDIHTSWCNDVPGANYNASTGAGSICVEFVGTSVTSVNSPLPVGVGIIQSQNSHMKYIDLDHHGYYTLDVRKGKTQADYTYVQTDQLGSSDDEAASYYVNDNERHLRPGAPIFNYPQITAPKPSLDPNQSISFTRITDQYLTINENESGSVNIIPSLQTCPAISMSIADAADHGITLSLNGQDVVYAPATDYNGYDTVAFAVCSLSPPVSCDTVYLFVAINSVQSRDTFIVHLSKDTVFNTCFSFDDLSSIGPVSYSTANHGIFSGFGYLF
ncbi:MAG: alkaline phosphatase D family protein [Bacteroidetes bacterium]|nr:alkaline phosphatase D family protein [Bacteroidota bacterium]